MASLKGVLLELKDIINNVLSRRIDFSSRIVGDEFHFKRREREYYSREIENAMKRLEAVLNESFTIAPTEKRALTEASMKIKDLKKMINSNKFLESVVSIEEIFDIVPSVRVPDGDLPKGEFYLPYIPRDIYSETKASFDELVKCYEHRCYRSALILCGRILEIALHKRYFDLTGRDLLQKSPDIGLGNLVLKFKEKEINLDPGLSNQIHLINHLRVASVHKSKRPFNPTKSQSKASILYTLDILKKLFRG
ncbi:MAG: hypothetical protein IB618_02875 [Candidatus Pacearchaeota archaeon]|nr:MAG: hypothetical protein IB618_02875 [Candidatus Pacearchaeota archaeon]